MCSSFKMREVRPSGPTALPGFNLDSCFAMPLTDMVISGTVRKRKDMGKINSMRWHSFKGIILVKTYWNLVLRMLAFSTVAVWLMPFDLRFYMLT